MANSRPRKTPAVTGVQSVQQQPAKKMSQSNEEHLVFWQSLADHEFFGPRLKHLYFYGTVTEADVLLLREQVLDACRGKREEDGTWVDPKPILVHVHSRGGDMWAMQWLLSLFNQVNVPLCVMVDALSASAATALSVMAPYRVGSAHSMSLIHDYTWGGRGSNKREVMLSMINQVEMHRDNCKRLYMARTRMTETEIESMLRRDMWLDAPTCLRLGLYDRVLHPDRRSSVRAYLSSSKMAMDAGYTSDRLLSKTDWNRVFESCGEKDVEKFPRAFDALMHNEDQAKPILYVTPGGSSGCYDPMIAVAMIARIQSSPVPVMAVVDNLVTWWQMLPVMFCHRRFMYETAMLDSNMAYETSWGMRLTDIVHNASAMRKLISDVVKLRGKPTAKLLDDMFDRPLSLTAAECKANGLVDEVVTLAARDQLVMGGMRKQQRTKCNLKRTRRYK